MGIIQSIEGLHGTKGGGGKESPPFFPVCLFKLRHWSSPILGQGIIPLTPSGSQVFGLGLNYTTGFPGFPACQWQIMGLLSLRNHLSQSFLHDIYLSIESTDCICSISQDSPEKWDISLSLSH